ncbi:hypothetical protein G210_3502 [Candida maltosa Xu316]|uniref:Uncharacterized protein n=1 Tax=Candida maltosa (strain Xu316) TaxID=1245528 RepID=M3J2Z2_CANMX|nr:hypothetical protein G210_3502 [Candida maltosa Xu316]
MYLPQGDNTQTTKVSSSQKKFIDIIFASVIGFALVVFFIHLWFSKKKKGQNTKVTTQQPSQCHPDQVSIISSPSMYANTFLNQEEDYVPPYTFHPDTNDMGFYDEQGQFHLVNDIIKPPDQARTRDESS